VHTLDPARVAERVGDVDAAVARTLARVEGAEKNRRDERRGYYVALGLAGLLLATLVLKAWDYDRRRRREASP
jgi:hypothetical protein